MFQNLGEFKGALEVGRQRLADRLQLLIEPGAESAGNGTADCDDGPGGDGGLVDFHRQVEGRNLRVLLDGSEAEFLLMVW